MPGTVATERGRLPCGGLIATVLICLALPVFLAAEETEDSARDLEHAIQNRRNAAALAIIQAHPELLQPLSHDTPQRAWRPEYCFIAALRYRNPELAAALLKAGAPINGHGILGATALHYAAGNDPNLMVWLLNNGADPNCADDAGIHPLHVAFATGESAFVTTLLEHGADPTATAKGRTCLYFAAGSDHPERMIALLKPFSLPAEGATDANASALHAYLGMYGGCSPYTNFDHQSRKIRLETFDDLVRRGARFSATDQAGQTLLHFMVQQELPTDVLEDLLNRCLKAGVQINAADKNGLTALDAAVTCGDYEWVLLLCRRGATLGPSGTEFNRTVKALLEQDPTKSIYATYRRRILALGSTFAKKPPTVEEWQNLHQQLKDLHAQTFTALLAQTTDIDTADSWGRRLLQIAAGLDDPRYLQIVLARHPDLNLTSAGEMTALHNAAFWGQERNVELLLDAGADPWRPNSLDQMPINSILHSFSVQFDTMPAAWLPPTVADLTPVIADPELFTPSNPTDPGLRIRRFTILQRLYSHQFTRGNVLIVVVLIPTVLVMAYAIRRKQAQHRRRHLSVVEDERMNAIMARADWHTLAPAFARRRQLEIERRRLRLELLLSLLGAGIIVAKFTTDPVLRLYFVDDHFRMGAMIGGGGYVVWLLGAWLPWRPVRTITAVPGGLATLGACGWGFMSAADVARYPHLLSLAILLVCNWAVVGLAVHASLRLLVIESKVRRETANLVKLPAALPHSDDIDSQPAWDHVKPPAP